MKKLLSVLAVAVLTILTPFAVSAPASAQSTCGTGFTGPDSNNQCTSTTQYSCTVSNENNVTIVNDTNQVVGTGSASGGSATSGSTVNVNGTTYTITIANEDVCTATVVVPATEQPPAPTLTSVQPTQATGAAVLPATSGDFATLLVVIASSLAVVAALGVGGVALYRYYKSL